MLLNCVDVIIYSGPILYVSSDQFPVVNVFWGKIKKHVFDT